MTRPILSAILSCESDRLSDDEKYLFSKYNPLGINLFSRNLKSKEQTKELIEDIKNVINREDVLIAIDQEGGRVNRLHAISSQQYASSKQLAKRDIKYTTYHAMLISKELNDLGINLNYSPVVDIENSSSVMEGRSFSKDTDIIVSYAQTMADEYIKQGVCPCIKHIPGHFFDKKDPHLQSITIDLSRDEIEKHVEYIKNFAKYPMAMVSHVILNNIDHCNPVTTSSIVMKDIIRGFLGFDSLIISDAIDMHALKGCIAEKTVNVLDAGIDVICYCSGKLEDLQAICNEKRFMTEKSLNRFDKIKKIINNTNKWKGDNLILEQYNDEFQEDFKSQYTYDATETLEKMLKKGEN